MEDDLKKNNGRRPQKKIKIEDDLNYFLTRMRTSKKMEDDLKKIMEDDLQK